MAEMPVFTTPKGVRVFAFPVETEDDELFYIGLRMEVPEPVTPEIAADVEHVFTIMGYLTPYEQAGVIDLGGQPVFYGTLKDPGPLDC